MVVSGKMFEMWAICVKRFCSNLPQQVLELLDSYNFDKTELAQLEKKSCPRSCGSRLQLCWNLQSEQYNTRQQSISVEPDLSGVWACGGWSWCVGDLERWLVWCMYGRGLTPPLIPAARAALGGGQTDRVQCKIHNKIGLRWFGLKWKPQIQNTDSNPKGV